MTDDATFMARALELAERGRGSVTPNPRVGAVLVRDGAIVAEGWHTVFGGPHAEVECLRQAEERGVNPAGATMYVTLEPCAMCVGAMFHARIRRLVFGAKDPKTGACGSVIGLFAEPKLNHHGSLAGGVLAQECGALLSSFFAARRARTEVA